MINVQIYQSETLCSVLVSCGDRSVTGLFICHGPRENKPELFTARIVCRRHLVPRFEPCALERTTTDEITGEDREQMATWLTKKMMPVVVNLRIHDRMQSHEGDYDD